jgi:hypothetical protein
MNFGLGYFRSSYPRASGAPRHMKRWIGLSALSIFILMFPGASPQAGIVRAFGAQFFFSHAYCDQSYFWRAKGPIYTSLGQRPRNSKAQNNYGLKARSI